MHHRSHFWPSNERSHFWLVTLVVKRLMHDTNSVLSSKQDSKAQQRIMQISIIFLFLHFQQHLWLGAQNHSVKQLKIYELVEYKH